MRVKPLMNIIRALMRRDAREMITLSHMRTQQEDSHLQTKKKAQINALHLSWRTNYCISMS